MNKTDGEPDYQPVSCDAYSMLELAIMRRQRLRLAWHEGNVCFALPVMPLDLETRTGQEFLHCLLPSGERKCIRLDRIDRADPA